MHPLFDSAHRKVHKHLKLQHHKHTGRVLHHRHTSYRGIGVVLVLAGITMLAATWVQRAAASELMGVGGTVMAPVPSGAATITIPASGDTVSSSDNLVAGTCPVAAPQVAIVLAIDGTVVGSAMCDQNNDFALPVQLSPGDHTIVAQTHTVTQGRGIDSTPVQISYTNSLNRTQPSDTVVATSKSPFAVLAGGVSAVWEGVFAGGTAPYSVLVAWGDGKTNHYTVASSDSQYFSHQYKTSDRSYNARIAVADMDGYSVQYQYATVAYTTPVAPAAAHITSPPLVTPTMAGLYGLFLTVSSVSLIVWGEAKHAARQAAPAV